MKLRQLLLPFLDRRVGYWLRPDQLGQSVTMCLKDGGLTFLAPESIGKHVTLRFAGRGRRLGRWQGDLVLKLWLNCGMNLVGDLWLSTEQARRGGVHPWGEGPRVRVRIPAGLKAGATLRVRGQGHSALAAWRSRFGKVPRGDLVLTLRTFEEAVAPPVMAVEQFSTELLGLEGWIYRQRDELREALGRRLPKSAPTVYDVAAEFNRGGWRSVADCLQAHFGLRGMPIQFEESPELSHPGMCKTEFSGTNHFVTSRRYEIWVKSSLMNHPFMAAAILAHELCHVVLLNWLTPDLVGRMQRKLSPKETLEEERTVDLLVFLFGVGEFQVRVAQADKLTLGYFDQRNFNRMLRILSQR